MLIPHHERFFVWFNCYEIIIRRHIVQYDNVFILYPVFENS